MYNSNYVRKKKRRKVVAVISGISSITVVSLIIISFLGKYTGTFTIKLENGSVRLALYEYTGVGNNPEDHTDVNNLSTYLRVNALPNMSETTYSRLEAIGDDLIDNEKTTWKDWVHKDPTGKNEDIDFIDFFKFTFCVVNRGSTAASYMVNLKINESKPTDEEEPRYLEDTLRVMLYENYQENESVHEKKVFARPNKNGQREAISYTEERAQAKHAPFYGYADNFENDSLITSYTVENLEGHGVMRYTIVYWLEGEDPDSRDDLEAPKNAFIKLGVEINVFEDENENK